MYDGWVRSVPALLLVIEEPRRLLAIAPLLTGAKLLVFEIHRALGYRSE